MFEFRNSVAFSPQLVKSNYLKEINEVTDVIKFIVFSSDIDESQTESIYFIINSAGTTIIKQLQMLTNLKYAPNNLDMLENIYVEFNLIDREKELLCDNYSDPISGLNVENEMKKYNKLKQILESYTNRENFYYNICMNLLNEFYEKLLE